jgi:hypothetical protein
MTRKTSGNPSRTDPNDVPNCQTGPSGRLRFVLREARLAWVARRGDDLVRPYEATSPEPDHPSQHESQTPRGLS